ncbi:MAG: UDP-4-amino-4,6-dideoxy-N-acetyl-beta-L-altrosamine N-acetyltransferase [Gimesia sp.]
MKIVQGYLRKMVENDLSLVLQWRNHPDVRRYMYTQHEITPEEHVQWFSRLCHDDRQSSLVFVIDEIPLGYVNFKRNATLTVADWGFYLAPDAPKGTGSQLGTAALDYAFEQMKLHKVCGQALGYNEKSKGFHLRFGFKREGVLRQQHFDGENYYDVECFGLLANEWTGREQ